MTPPDAVLHTLNARDTPGFAAAIAALPGALDDYELFDHSILGWLAREGWAEGIQVMLEAGSSASDQPEVLLQGIFPTLQMGTDVRALELLLDAGISANLLLEDELMETPLRASSVVIEERGEAITRLLLSRGADPNVLVEYSLPPLHNACLRPCSGTVRALLEGGANPNILNDEGSTALQLLVYELKAAEKRSAQNPEDNSFEIAAAFVPESMAALLEHGADATLLTPEGKSVLWPAMAMAACPSPVLEMLLDAGAPTEQGFNYKGEQMDLLAFSLLRAVSAPVACKLLDAGCPLDVPYENIGQRCYLDVVCQYAPENALALWDHDPGFGERLLAYRDEGSSVLVPAVAGGNGALVRRLHAGGLSAKEPNASGRTPLQRVADHLPDSLPMLQALADTEA